MAGRGLRQAILIQASRHQYRCSEMPAVHCRWASRVFGHVCLWAIAQIQDEGSNRLGHMAGDRPS
jgi:hypothetical protein